MDVTTASWALDEGAPYNFWQFEDILSGADLYQDLIDLITLP